MACAKPDAPPVTTATRPLRSKSWSVIRRLRAHRRIRRPAVELGQRSLCEPRPRIQPRLRPRAPIVLFALRVPTAACDEPGEGRAARRHADRLVAQVEAPAD